MSRVKLDLKSNVLKIDISKVDQRKLGMLDKEDAIKYILSTIGIPQRSISIPEFKNKTSNHAIDRRITGRPENYFLNLFRESFKVGNQSPLATARYFGVEIECFVNLEALNIDRRDYSPSESRECCDCEGSGQLTYTHRDSGHEVEETCQSCDGGGYTDEACDSDSDSELFEAVKHKLSRRIKENKIKGVDIKEDGSLSHDDDDMFPVEFTILVKQDDFSNLEKLCTMLSSIDAVVNKTCGLHAHVDMRGETSESIELIGNGLGKYLACLSSMVPATRRDNRFCRSRVSSSDRYSAINLCAFEKQSTIEFRLHSATTDFVKISNWLKIIGKLVKTAQVAPLSRKCSIPKFLKMFDAEMQNYIKERMKLFGGLEESDFELLADSEDFQMREGA